MLVDVNLSAEPGSRVVVAGPSGAGKTTLLRAVAGLEPCLSGRISLSGRRLEGLPAHRRRIAMVFQEARLLPHLKVLDNVALPLRAAGTSKAERYAAALERLEEVGLEDFATRGVTGLSGGEQQRVALARALCGEPDLLLLDEPLAALDPNRREDLRELILDIQGRRGLTTILVTHDRSEAAELGETIALMVDGKIEQQDEAQTLFERPASVAVARFFGNRNLVRLEHGRPGQLWAVRPERVRLGVGSRFGKVVDSSYRGTHVRVMLDWQGQQVEAHVETNAAPSAGADIRFDLPEDALWLIPDA